VVDDLASKGERDRSHISLQRTDEARFWTRHLCVDRATLEAVIAKVGNSATAVRKELAARRFRVRSFLPELTNVRRDAITLRALARRSFASRTRLAGASAPANGFTSGDDVHGRGSSRNGARDRETTHNDARAHDACRHDGDRGRGHL
jgi:hypothetical protein